MTSEQARGLPEDPDVEVASSATGGAIPVHLRPGMVALVFAGGAIGTAVREALSLAFPPVGGIPVTIFAINVVGAFALGVLLELLVRRGPDHGGRRRARLLFGTGVLGGFTTYSALATDTALLVGGEQVAAGVVYALATVVVGALASWTGILTGAALHHRSRRARG